MSGFKKFDTGKLRWNLMPEEALEEVLKVLEFGASRYGDFNWISNSDEVEWTRYSNALERHFKKWKRGIDVDSDSGLLELAHMATNNLMLLQYHLLKLGKDNRDYRLGTRHGLLTVKEFISMVSNGDRLYKCQCDCGKTSEVIFNNLKKGNTTSCGCVQKAKVSERSTTHGKSGTLLYGRYMTMLSRCYDNNHIQYKDYGGRGITVSDDWAEFENFLRDMGEPPTEKYQLDRIDNDGPYSKENCRWVTTSENARNTPSKKGDSNGK